MAKSRLAGVSTGDLSLELRRRQRRLPTLRNKHQKLARKLEAIEAQIAQLGGDTGGRGRGITGRKRPKNDQPLAEVLVALLKKKGKQMKVSEIAQGALASGYKTNAANFSTIVNQTLIKDKRFKSVERGYYALV